ncbi:hypothetical protein SLS55_005851 [Diplodia seriata]|uniref:Uncharacterized protein n=1 Tax=Diplodia seriata TaxID=420778 RepID=A0ABR3CK92_9PEZI
MATTSAKPPCFFPAIAKFQVRENAKAELIGVLQPSSGHDSCALMAQVAPAEDSSNIPAAIRLSLIPSTTLDDSSRQSIDIIFTVNNIRTLTHNRSSANGTLPKLIKKEARKTFADQKRQNVTEQEIADNVSNLSLTLKQPPTAALPRNVWPLVDESEMSRVRTLRSLTRCTSVMLYFMRDDVVNSALYNFSIAVHSHRGGGGGAVRTAPTHVILNGLSDPHWDRYRVYHRPAVTTTVKRKIEEGSDDLLNGHSSKRVKQGEDKDELDSGRHGNEDVMPDGAGSAARELSPMRSMHLSRQQHDQKRRTRRGGHRRINPFQLDKPRSRGVSQHGYEEADTFLDNLAQGLTMSNDATPPVISQPPATSQPPVISQPPALQIDSSTVTLAPAQALATPALQTDFSTISSAPAQALATPGPTETSSLTPNELVERWREYHGMAITSRLNGNTMVATQRVLATGLEAARAGDEETFKETMADVFMRVCEQGGGIKKEEADDEPQAG